jgi:hypothetical protein
MREGLRMPMQPDSMIEMITNRSFAFCFLIIISLPLAADAASPPGTAPGAYHDWAGEIDQVVIIQPFHADNYRDIAVESFDSTGVQLPDRNDNTYEAVHSALQAIKPAFMEGLQNNLRPRAASQATADLVRGKAQALVIRSRLTKVDPGSQAARYWVGYGAGAVKIDISGEIIDHASNKTLVTFKQERRSGVGVFGGGYGALFARTARQIGADVARLINAF